VAWAGPVFWPYAYNDLFYYASWPYAYDDAYWAYAYDDFVDGIFWGYANPYAEYADAGPDIDARGRTTHRSSSRQSTTSRQTAELCQPAKGFDWPFEQIESEVRPTDQQRVLLEALKDAAAQAAAAFKTSCPGDIALTPTGRLQAMIVRLDATLQALRIVRPPLDAFYNALSDEQKARYNAIGPDVADRAREARDQSPDQEACRAPKGGLTSLPIERIEDLVRPTDRQQPALDRLSQATDKAVASLQAACPDFTPQTPVGRLEAMEKRVAAMLDAARTVEPVLQDFYASLSNEQKSRFNTLARETKRRG
jgi:hypothetical protein